MASPKPFAATTPTHPGYALLARAHSPNTAVSLFTDKVLHKPLLLRASSPPAFADKRALRRHIRLTKKSYYLRKQKPQPLSAKAKRALGVYDLPHRGVEYETYRGLNKLWRAYIREVLGLGAGDTKAGPKQITAAQHGALLASADFHGAQVEVVKSACVGRVGTRGIVVRDTKFTFVLVGEGGVVRRVPKGGSVFRVVVPLGEEDDEEGEGAEDNSRDVDGDGKMEVHTQEKKLVFDLHGSQLQVRPAERANRKFKLKVTDYL